MRKIFFAICCLLGGKVLAAEAKKMGNKEVVIRKQRTDSFQKIQKPRYFATNPLTRTELQDQHTIQDIDCDIKNLPFEYQLEWDKKHQKRWRQNLVRAGLGAGFNSDETFFAGLVDVLFHKKIKDFSTHLIFSLKEPNYPGLKENVELYADYPVTDFFKPYIIFGQKYKHFKKKSNENEKIKIDGTSLFNFRVVAGCPFVFEKIKLNPELSYQFSNIGLSMSKNDEKVPDCTEHDLTLYCDASMQFFENQEFSIATSLKNLFYNKNCPIATKNKNDKSAPGFVLEPLGNQNNVHFLHIQPKYLLTIKDFYLGPKLTIDYCSNKKFVRKSSAFSFRLGLEAGWHINDIFDVYLDFDNGMKIFTAESAFKMSPWATPQAMLSTIDQWGFVMGGNAKLSKFKFNASFGVNRFDIYHDSPIFCKDKEKWDYPLGYWKNVFRFKETLGGSFENDFVTILLNGTFYQIPLGCFFTKLKSDIFVRIIEKILLHFNLRHWGALTNSSDYASNFWNLGLGADYLFSDLFGFFFSVENILKNRLYKYDVMPDGMVKLLFGVTLTPDRWFEKNSDEIVE